MTEQESKPIYSPLGKALEKQTEKIERQCEKEINAKEEHGEQMVKSNALINKHHLNIDKDGVGLEKQKEIFNKLLDERAYENNDLKDKINPNNLIYKFTTDGIDSKDCRIYRILVKLFKVLRDGDKNPKEALKFNSNKV